MSLTENSDQVFLPGGCNRTQNLRFGPYTMNGLYNFKGQGLITVRKSVLPKQRFRIEVVLCTVRKSWSLFQKMNSISNKQTNKIHTLKK